MERPKSAFTPDEPGALPLDQVLAQITKDDQEEWEYEYSTSETETFYLTVELSYPEFKVVSKRGTQHSRGGYYKDWTEPDKSGQGHKKAPQSEQPTGANSDNEDENDGNDNDNDEDEDTELGQDDQDDGTPLDPALLAMSRGNGNGKGKGKAKATTPLPRDKQKGKQVEFAKKAQSQSHTQDPDPGPDPEAEADTEDIQILDLHTASPFFSYRGRLFEGQWAEVIGTEAIFAHTSPSSPLPSLRDLPGDISLLAASSSRIMTTEKLPRPKMPVADALAAIKEKNNIRIPGARATTGERAEQVNFLENLMALKLKRSDKDQVTVYATDGRGKDWDDRRPVDYRPRRRVIASDDEEQRGSRKKKKLVGRRRVGRPSLATRLEGYPVGFGKPRGDFEFSVMTPASWRDLEREDEEQDEEGDEEGGEEEEEEDEGEEEEEEEESGGSDEDDDDDDGGDEDVTMIG